MMVGRAYLVCACFMGRGAGILGCRSATLGRQECLPHVPVKSRGILALAESWVNASGRPWEGAITLRDGFRGPYNPMLGVQAPHIVAGRGWLGHRPSGRCWGVAPATQAAASISPFTPPLEQL